jgi:AcrR family transcriptional regulator
MHPVGPSPRSGDAPLAPSGPALPDDSTAEVTDKRLARGARTRGLVLRRAVDIASLDGLGGLSFGGLAADTGLSKAGIQTLFRTKEGLQLATIRLAGEMFIEAVVRPAGSTPHGLARVRALLDQWITYAQTPLFAGGCFWVANMADFDSRPGPVRDALFGSQQRWTALLTEELRHAVTVGDVAHLDSDLAAFQIDAMLRAANTALQAGDDKAMGKVRRAVEHLLASAR